MIQGLGHNPLVGFLNAQVLLLLLPELGDQLVHNVHPEDFSGRVPEHEQCGGRHHQLERGKLLSHLSVAEGSNPHNL
jgi:hypothetical protein